MTGGAGDRPARHRALRDTIAWSYDLLGPEEQAAFRHLAPFAGGGPLAAALAVARTPARDATVPAEETAALRWLDGLVQRSLVRSEVGPDGVPRLVLLETIREYAIERLVASGELAPARDAHAAWFLALADTCALAAAEGAQDEALACLGELLPILATLGERWVLASCLERLGTTAALLGWPARATRCFGAADALRILIGAPSPPPDRARLERDLAAARAALGETAFAVAWHAGRTEPLAQILAQTWQNDPTPAA